MLLHQANICLNELNRFIIEREQELKKSVENLLEGKTTEIIAYGKILTAKEIAHYFYLFHFEATKIKLFNGEVKPWHDLELKESLNVARNIAKSLGVKYKIPIDIIQWME